MLKLLVIRHGETISNAEQRFSGHQDVNLTEKGILQAEQLAYRLRDCQIDAIYASDLKRAIHTAKIIIGNRNIPFYKEPHFREISFGDWEGLKWDEINAEKEEGNSDNWWNQPDSPLPGGESLRDLRKRIVIALKKVIREQDEEDKYKTVAIVCHGGVSRMIIGIALDVPMEKVWNIRQQSTALNIIRYDKKGGFFIDSVNDIAHLELLQKKEGSIEK
jgi:alpha-ribazole phosphatase